MAPFDELQALWQSQNPPVAPAAVAGAFRRYGRRRDLINIFKVVLIGFVLVRAILHLKQDPLEMAAILLILATAVIAIAAEWRIQRRIARLDFSAPSIDFVRGAIAHLQSQRNPYHTPAYLLFFAGIFVSYNLMTVASWHRLTLERRIIWHLASTASPVILYAFGRWCRAKTFNAEYRPLIERLRGLLETLEERAA
jgi:hypothetical protein